MGKKLRLSALALSMTLCLSAQLMAYGSAEKTYYEYTNIREVNLKDMSIYSIAIVGADTKVCRLELEYPENTRFKVHHDVRGGELRVWTKDTRVLFSSSAGPHSVKITVPQNIFIRSKSNTGTQQIDSVAGDLEISSDTGSVTMNNCSGMITLSADTGAVTLHHATGDINASSHTGALSLYDVQGTIRLQTDTGSVRLEDLLGAVTVETDTGSIKADKLLLNGDSAFSADTGSITLDLDNAMEDIKVFARSGLGRISVYDTEARKHQVWGTGPLLVELKTDTGSITVK